MQSLPVATTDLIATATDMANTAYSSAEAASGGSFDTVLSSFIEPDRTDYSGRPSGFSAHEDTGIAGTLSEKVAEEIKKSLRDRNVQEASIDLLDQMMAAGGPMSVGRVIGMLSGRSRASGTLEGQEREDFSLLMRKMGFSAEESGELLGLSDKGSGSGIWKNITSRLESGEGLDMNKAEFAALLKGLDISPAASEKMMRLFGEGGTLSKEQLTTLMADAGRELAARDLAAKAVQAQMRDALKEALQASRLKKLSEPVADARGSKRSEITEDTMQNGVLKKALSGLSPQNDHGESADAGFHEREGGGDTRSRAERILATAADAKPAEAKATKSPDAFRQMLHRLDVAVPQHAGQTLAAGEKPDLEALARTHTQEIFSQVEKGLLQNAQNGSRQITLTLNPEDLGQLTLVMNVRQGEVRAVIRADQQESATVLSEQLASLRTALEESGLKVAELEVQTQLQQDTTQQWAGSQEHNMMRDAQERARSARLRQLRREAVSEGPALQGAVHTEENTGMHIVA